jgi:hypothetical protein
MTYVYAKYQPTTNATNPHKIDPYTFSLAMTLGFISVDMCTSKTAGTSLQKIVY